ncbi:hypothetical protein [Methylomonas koyamae]|uniref:hypothetical protein n=1 Tax=Methylomonas koyamae TaxID=702114 RepID=UPI0011274469|nr:hypothetical protein [Methylomonas koyamae]TPQ24479.1 hypothetical protein C2U68_19640 [Methylomonas koyamae]
MPVFIASSLILTTLIETHNPVLPLLNLEAVWMSAAAIAAIFLLAGGLKRLSSTVWQDGFACASLWAWYGYWKPLFSEGSPQFSVFPVYFALLAAWMLFGFINRSPRFDWESQETFRYFETYLSRVTPGLIAALVLVCLALPEHYLSFPLAMTFFIIRSAFQRCIEIIDRL